MKRQPPESTRTYKLYPYTTLVRSSGLDIPEGRRKKLKAAAGEFHINKVEPIPAYSFEKRDDARRWIEMRHTGQGAGEGIVGWSGVATARFRGNSPSLQAIDLVRRFGDLSDDERERSEERRVGQECVSTCRSRWST